MVRAAGARGLCRAALAEAAVGGKAGGSGGEPSCHRPAPPPAATRADQRKQAEVAGRTGVSSYRTCSSKGRELCKVSAPAQC